MLRATTLVFLFRDDGHILLAMKKRGFGVGKWNGISQSDVCLYTSIDRSSQAREANKSQMKLLKYAIFSVISEAILDLCPLAGGSDQRMQRGSGYRTSKTRTKRIHNF